MIATALSGLTAGIGAAVTVPLALSEGGEVALIGGVLGIANLIINTVIVIYTRRTHGVVERRREELTPPPDNTFKREDDAPVVPVVVPPEDRS